MGKLSKFFGKRIAKTFSDTLDEMSKFAKEVSEIDFEKEFENISSSFSEEFSRLKEMVVNKTNPYVVEVSYDRDKQTLSFTIDNNLLSIKVSERNENGTFSSESTTTVNIPNDVDVEKIVQKYDKTRKIMTFEMKRYSILNKKEESETQVENEVQEEKSEVKKTKAKNSKELLDIIMDMYEKGYPYTAIAKEVGLSDKTVARYVKKVLLERAVQESFEEVK